MAGRTEFPYGLKPNFLRPLSARLKPCPFKPDLQDRYKNIEMESTASNDDVHGMHAELNFEFNVFRSRVLDRLDDFEARMLHEFRVWDAYFASRFRANEVLVGGFNERLVSLEERVSDIERRKDV